MAKQANKTLIGIFVVIAVLLAVAAVAIFGSGQFFQRTDRYVLFFPGSVKGLRVGAPVVFRGVQIGQVYDIKVRFDPEELSFEIPVIIDLIEGSINNANSGVSLNEKVINNFQEINSQVVKVSEVMAEITTSSNEQKLGIEQVNSAVNQMNNVTQQTAANSEESASASAQLTNMAEEMRQKIKKFNLTLN